MRPDGYPSNDVRENTCPNLPRTDVINRRSLATNSAEAEDKSAREKIDKLNQADSLVFQTEKQLKEFGDKLTETNKSAINAALEKLKEAHKSQDLTSIENTMNLQITAVMNGDIGGLR